MDLERSAFSAEVNGVRHESTVDPRLTLADFLREELRLTGTHLGCEHGVCGACTVLMNGQTVRSCLMLAVQADGSQITTIEGVAGSELSELQKAFRECHGLQCGFCTPGVILTAMELLEETALPDEGVIRDRLSGNICRCTGYQQIVDSILQAAGRSNA